MAFTDGPSIDIPDPFSARQTGTPELEVEPSRTALLVVDLVNDYVEPEGLMPMPGAEPGGGSLIEANRRLVEGARAAGIKVVWIRPGHLDSDDALFRKRIVHALEGTWGAELHSGLGVGHNLGHAGPKQFGIAACRSVYETMPDADSRHAVHFN